MVHKIVLVVAAALVGGCVERELTVTSNPPGALAYVSDVEVGRTPVTRSFTHYGDYDILLRMDDYQTVKGHANLRPPIYEWLGLDLLSEIAPWTYHDRRYVHFELSKRTAVGDEQLIRKAEDLRDRNAQPAR